MNIEELTPMQSKIRDAISKNFQRLGAERGVFAAIHSWGDTMPEDEVLQMLEEMNKEAL
jgi:aryl-alcohol dehydrogenase-like predicted oxidoreductase